MCDLCGPLGGWLGGVVRSSLEIHQKQRDREKGEIFFIPLSSSSNLHASASPLLPHPLPTTPIIFSTLLHYFYYFHFHAISRFCVVFLSYAFKITPPRLSFLFFIFRFCPFLIGQRGIRKKKKKGSQKWLLPPHSFSLPRPRKGFIKFGGAEMYAIPPP